MLVELGSSDFLKRYQTYVSHVQEWRQQFQKLESVNLRYDNQVIVNPDMEGRPKQPALAASAARAAAAAGVKPAALITRTGPHEKPLPKPAFELTEKKFDPKSAVAKKPAARTKLKRTAARTTRGRAPKKATRPATTAPKASAASAKPSPAIGRQQASSN